MLRHLLLVLLITLPALAEDPPGSPMYELEKAMRSLYKEMGDKPGTVQIHAASGFKFVPLKGPVQGVRYLSGSQSVRFHAYEFALEDQQARVKTIRHSQSCDPAGHRVTIISRTQDVWDPDGKGGWLLLSSTELACARWVDGKELERQGVPYMTQGGVPVVREKPWW